MFNFRNLAITYSNCPTFAVIYIYQQQHEPKGVNGMKKLATSTLVALLVVTGTATLSAVETNESTVTVDANGIEWYSIPAGVSVGSVPTA